MVFHPVRHSRNKIIFGCQVLFNLQKHKRQSEKNFIHKKFIYNVNTSLHPRPNKFRSTINRRFQRPKFDKLGVKYYLS